MINRLLDRIDTPRRHLAVLMALLSITFVLTGVLAWQAHVSQRENSDVKIVTSKNVASTGAKDIGTTFANFAGGSVPLTHNEPALKAFLYQPDVSLLELAKLTTLDSLCPDCAGVSPRTYFAIDVKTGKIDLLGDPVDVDLDQFLLSRVRSGPSGYAQLNSIMAFGFYAVPLRKTPIALAYISLDGDQPVRIYGAFIDSTTVHTLMHRSIDVLTLHPEAKARGLSTHDLIAVRMYAGTTRVFATGERGEEPPGQDLSIPPVFGAKFEANVRDSAAEILFPRQNVAQWLVLGTLVTLIALLFGASLLLVRREAEVARMRADFVASASHELRTPLAQIRMFTETLLLGRVRSDTERRRSLEIVDQEARRLSNLVENLLAFSRNEGGRMVRLAPEPTHVADEIRRAMESFAPMVRTSTVDLRAELQENVSVAVDRNALRQILVNLIDNALKYGPAGQRVTVGLALFDDAARVWVDDEGPGIPTTDQEKVFESFYRMRRDIDARITGSGIGLAVVRQLARLHAGEAWAEAAPGGGARIVVQFPGAYLREAAAGNLAAAS